jgi:N-methylhydantoinase B/oxoprolinase/acetone carboxylase alpha subunit
MLAGLHISLSYEVCPEIRDYERACTTHLNAYLQPPVDRYLKHLDEELRARDAAVPMQIMQSYGGITSASESPRKVNHRLHRDRSAGRRVHQRLVFEYCCRSQCGLLLFLDPMIPRNSGFFRPLHVIAAPRTLVNPRPPAPIGGSTLRSAAAFYDVVIVTLSNAWKEKALGTWSMMWLGVFNSGTHPETAQLFIQAMFDGLGIGGGVRIAGDGLNATCIAASNVLIPNVEIEEELLSVRYLRREIKIDTGGPEKFRGACALETEIEFLTDCDSTILGSRLKFPAAGNSWGQAWRPEHRYSISSDSTVTEYPPKITGLRFKKGDRLVTRACGGGGPGDPLQREHWRIEEDIRFRRGSARLRLPR